MPTNIPRRRAQAETAGSAGSAGSVKARAGVLPPPETDLADHETAAVEPTTPAGGTGTPGADPVSSPPGTTDAHPGSAAPAEGATELGATVAPAVVAGVTPAAPSALPVATPAERLPDASTAIQVGGWVIVILFLVAALLWGVAARNYGIREVAARAAGTAKPDEHGPTAGRLAELGVNGWAWCWAFLAIGLGLLLLQLLAGPRGYGVFRPLIGTDRRFSTSLTQIGLWTVLITTTFAWLLILAGLTGKSVDTLLPPQRWGEYLLLLGGPFAAAVAAKGIVTYKVRNGTLQKTEPEKTELRQVATMDDGGTDVVDSQYLLFNLVAQVYFVVAVTHEAVLPVMPDVLLAMTSLTAATYVGAKAARTNAPVITSLSPKTVAAGTEVTVLGSNFDPRGAASPLRFVTISISGLAQDIPVAADEFTDTRAWFTMPPGATPGAHQRLQLTSTAGVATVEYDIEVT